MFNYVTSNTKEASLTHLLLTSLEDLQELPDNIFSQKETFQLLLTVINEYKDALIEMDPSNEVDDLTFLKLILLIIKKFPLVLDKKDTETLSTVLGNNFQTFKHKALIQILLTAKDTLNNFHLFFQVKCDLQKNLDDFFLGSGDRVLSFNNGGIIVFLEDFYEAIIANNYCIGSLSAYYHLEEKCNEYLYYRKKGRSIQQSKLDIIFLTIKRGLTEWLESCLFPSFRDIERKEALLNYHMNLGKMKFSSLLFLIKPLLMLCDLQQRNAEILLQELKTNGYTKLIVSLCDNILNINSQNYYLKNESNDFISSIKTIFKSGSLNQTDCASLITLICDISEKILAKIGEKNISAVFEDKYLLNLYLYNLFEAYSYAHILAEKINLKVNSKKIMLFKEQVLSLCLEDKKKGPYIAFLIEHTNETVEKELEKIKLAKNRYTNFCDVVIFTKYEKFEEAIEQDHPTTFVNLNSN